LVKKGDDYTMLKNKIASIIDESQGNVAVVVNLRD